MNFFLQGGKQGADLDALIAVSMKDVDLDKIEVTEEDLMDDDLLSELNDVLGMFTLCVSVSDW